jgi:hypothetical protein
MPGPAPKKDAERTRRNAPESGAARHGQLRPVTMPNADRKNWHPRALAWFDSLKSSGQADFYQDSDWAMAKVTADYLTRWYQNPKAMDMANILALMGRFGTTEGDRRQILRLELEPQVEEDKSATLIAIDGYREALLKKQA